ncbi:MAG: NAD(P)-binding domain-containing protein, partial [Porticoccaceae bacterium]
MKIGFVGLGNMGNAIAVNLIKAGHKLVISDLARELQSNLELQGAKWCNDLARLGAGCEVVFTALPGPADVEEVMLGARGVLNGMDPGAFYIDLTTSSAATVAKVAA